MLMNILDQTIVNVALPSIQADLGFSQSGLAWLINQAINWHWILFVNLPIGIAAVLLALWLIESDRGIGLGEGADVAGAILVTAALMLGVYTIVEVPGYGWGSAHTLGFGAVAL